MPTHGQRAKILMVGLTLTIVVGLAALLIAALFTPWVFVF